MGEHQYRSTRTIASHNNLTMDRVRFLCSHDERIHLSTGEEEDMWNPVEYKPLSDGEKGTRIAEQEAKRRRKG